MRNEFTKTMIPSVMSNINLYSDDQLVRATVLAKKMGLHSRVSPKFARQFATTNWEVVKKFI